jgi:hypothetical protein
MCEGISRRNTPTSTQGVAWCESRHDRVVLASGPAGSRLGGMTRPSQYPSSLLGWRQISADDITTSGLSVDLSPPAALLRGVSVHDFKGHTFDDPIFRERGRSWGGVVRVRERGEEECTMDSDGNRTLLFCNCFV